jgi:hypothetical protein
MNCSKHTPSHSRGTLCPSFVSRSAPKKSEGAGNAGCPLHPRPVCRKNAHGSHHRYSGINRRSLRNGFNGLCRALPGDEFVLSPSPADLMAIKPGWADLASAGLTPATGARTTRFCRTQPPPNQISTGHVPVRRSSGRRPGFANASPGQGPLAEASAKTQAPFVPRAVDAHGKIRPASSLARRRCRVHRIHPALVTIATRPSLGWNGSRIAVSLPIGEAKYFSAWGWTRQWLICPTRLGKNSAFSGVDVRFGS